MKPFALLNYLKTSGKYPKFPSSSQTQVVKAANDSFYKKYKANKNYYVRESYALPKLYASVRSYAIKHNGYQVSGTNPLNVSGQLKGVAASYGYKGLSAKQIFLWSYKSQVIKEIDAGYPTIWNMASSATYGSHTAVVTGYQVYRKRTSVLGISFYKSVELMQLNDNWNGSARFFDFTSYGGFGSFIRVR